MHRSIEPPRRTAAVGIAILIAAVSVTAVAMAAVRATDSKSKKAKVKCPSKVTSGKKVTCKVIGQLPKGPKGATGSTGAPGAPGSPGLSGYEVVSQTFKEVFIVNSGGQRGLSEVKTVSCPSGKQAIGGGSDLGTNESQNGQQRQVIVSLNGPDGAGSGWSVQLFNNSTSIDTSIDLRVYAICATVG